MFIYTAAIFLFFAWDIAQSSIYEACIDNVGTEFTLVFPESKNEGFSPILYMTSIFDTPSTVQIVAPLLPDTIDIFVTVQHLSTTVVELNDTLRLSGNGIKQSVVVVLASASIVLFASDIQNSTGDSFVVYPVDSLGTTYVSANYASVDSDQSVLAFIAISEETNITVTQPGQVFDVVLYPYEAYQMKGFDLTGTILNSSAPIAVFSGHTFLRPTLGSSSADQAVEQMIPVNLWSTEYILVPGLDDSVYDEYARIVTYYQDTTVSIEHESYGYAIRLTEPGSYHDVNISRTGYVKINSDKQISVAQIFPNSGTELYGDTSLLMAPAVDNFKNSYVFITPTLIHVSKTYLVLIADTNAKNGIIFDGVKLGLTWTNLTGSPNYFFTLFEITLGTHSVYSENADGKFGGFLRGNWRYTGYSTPIGKHFLLDKEFNSSADEGSYRDSYFKLIYSDVMPTANPLTTTTRQSLESCCIACLNHSSCVYLAFNDTAKRCYLYNKFVRCDPGLIFDIGIRIYEKV